MKKILSLFALFAVLGGTGVAAFALWDTLEAEEAVSITVGEGVTMSVNLDEQTNGNLVPNGAILKTGDVTSVDVDFTVQLDVEVIEALNLDVTVDNILIDGVDTNASLVNASIVAPATIDGSETNGVEVVITVTLDMPADEAQYDAVVNKSITFDVEFLATEQGS